MVGGNEIFIENKLKIARRMEC